jgi:hypothetical protein
MANSNTEGNFMNWFTDIENEIITTAVDVEQWILALIKGGEVAVADLGKGINWLASQAPAIDAGVKEAALLLQEVIAATPGAAQNATVTAAIADINNVAAGINAFATAANTGTSNAQALVQGYAAYQAAAASVASAKAAAAAASSVASKAAA